MTVLDVERDRLFGTDLRVVKDTTGHDLAVSGSGDLVLASGSENIIQALTLRLLVRRGALAALGWPRYGSRLHELIGEPNTNRTRTILMVHARSAVMADSRVADVTSVTASVLPGERDAVRLELSILLVSKAMPVSLTLDLSLGAA